VTKKYYEALDEGKILGMKCAACGAVEWPPVPTCNTCGGLDMEWTEIQGEATVGKIEPVPPVYMKPPFDVFAPYFVFEGTLAEGTPVQSWVIRLTPDAAAAAAAAERVEAGEIVKAKAAIADLGETRTVAFTLEV
jgi:uncharacterized OB-fold protein